MRRQPPNAAIAVEAPGEGHAHGKRERAGATPVGGSVASTPLAGSRSSKPCRAGSTPAARSALTCCASKPAVNDPGVRLSSTAPRFSIHARSSRRRRPQSATLVVGVRLSPTAPVSSFDGRYIGCNPLDEGSIPSELSERNDTYAPEKPHSRPYLLAGQGSPALNRTTRVRIPLGTPLLRFPPRLGGNRVLVFEAGFLRSTRSGETTQFTAVVGDDAEHPCSGGCRTRVSEAR